MAIVHKEHHQLDWPGFPLPERWRRWLEFDADRDGWLRMEEFHEDDTLVLRSEIPGIDPDRDVEISVEDGALSICAHRELTSEQKDKEGFRSEFRYGELSRILPLPPGVTAADVKATYGDGILEVRVPLPGEPEPEKTTVPVTRT